MILKFIYFIIFCQASRGNCHLELGNVKEALVEYDETINLNPTDGQNYLNRAKVYFDLELFKVIKCQHAFIYLLIFNIKRKPLMILQRLKNTSKIKTTSLRYFSVLDNVIAKYLKQAKPFTFWKRLHSSKNKIQRHKIILGYACLKQVAMKKYKF